MIEVRNIFPRSQRESFCALLLFGCVSTATVPLRAQSADPRSEAAQHFARGVGFVDSGDLRAAAVEFEAANDLVPSAQAAYNASLAYAELGRPLDAVSLLRRIQPEDASVPRAKIDTLLMEQAARLGLLTVHVTDTSGRKLQDVDLDVPGMTAAQVALDRAFEAPAGPLLVNARAPGYVSKQQRVLVRAGAAVALTVELAAIARRPALLHVETPLLDAAVWIDGKLVGTTPNVPETQLPPGAHVVEVRRAGYDPVRRDLHLADGERRIVRVTPAPARDPVFFGELRVRTNEPWPTLLVDGAPWRGSSVRLRLPEGRHRLEVRAAGRRPRSEILTVTRGQSREWRVWLDATDERAAEDRESAARQRALAAVLVTTGALASAVGAGLLVHSDGELADLDHEVDAFNATASPGGSCWSSAALERCRERSRQLNRERESLERERLVGAVAVGSGAVALGAAIVLFATAPPAPAEARRRFELGFSILPGNAGLSAQCAF